MRRTARVLGLGTSLAGEFTARGFVAINFGVAIGMLGDYAANDNEECSRFAVWLLVQGVLGVVLGVYAFVLLTKAYLQDPCGSRQVAPHTAAAPARRSVKQEGADSTTDVRCFSAVRGAQDSLLTVTYAAMFTWLIIGGVWFFDSDPVQAGSCAHMRRFGLGYTAAVFLLLALCLVVGTATAFLPVMQAVQAPPTRVILVPSKTPVEDDEVDAEAGNTTSVVRPPSVVLPGARPLGSVVLPRRVGVSVPSLEQAADRGIDTGVDIGLPVQEYVQAVSTFSSSNGPLLVKPYSGPSRFSRSPQRHLEEL